MLSFPVTSGESRFQVWDNDDLILQSELPVSCDDESPSDLFPPNLFLPLLGPSSASAEGINAALNESSAVSNIEGAPNEAQQHVPEPSVSLFRNAK